MPMGFAMPSFCIKIAAWQSEVLKEVKGQVSEINYSQEAKDFEVFMKSGESRPRNQRLS